MDVPYHRAQVSGDILVAARGASLHTFRARDGVYLATWRLPAADKTVGGRKGHGDAPAAGETNSATPPPKRRRLEKAAGTGVQPPAQDAAAGAHDAADSEAQRSRRMAASVTAALRSGDLPVVSILEATADGRHVIVVMGHDKTVRVLEHDGAGHLTQRSARTVPKRPCGVAVTADGQTILSGDKFGDVYALPLAEVEAAAAPAAAPAAPAAPATSAPTAAPTAPPPSAPLFLEANTRTVHTKGNRQALENQLRQKALPNQQPRKLAPTDAPDCRLLLGHVSMLTAVAVAEALPVEARDSIATSTTTTRPPLILSADRDEHIRVTRGVIGPTPQTSQTHVIETFCLGHTAFVSRMCIAAARPDRLVSASGDGDLRVWDFWPTGRTVGSAALGPLVEAAVRAAGGTDEAPKVAISGLYTFAGRDGTSQFVVICERVPGLFFFRLQADGCTLTHEQTLSLPGLPLDVGVATTDGATRLFVAMAAATSSGAADADVSDSLRIVARQEDDSWALQETRPAVPQESGHDDVDPTALRYLLLFGIESLRKTEEE